MKQYIDCTLKKDRLAETLGYTFPGNFQVHFSSTISTGTI